MGLIQSEHKQISSVNPSPLIAFRLRALILFSLKMHHLIMLSTYKIMEYIKLLQ